MPSLRAQLRLKKKKLDAMVYSKDLKGGRGRSVMLKLARLENSSQRTKKTTLKQSRVFKG